MTLDEAKKKARELSKGTRYFWYVLESKRGLRVDNQGEHDEIAIATYCQGTECSINRNPKSDHTKEPESPNG